MKGQDFLVRGGGTPTRRSPSLSRRVPRTRGGRSHGRKVAGFERAWNAGAELGVLYGIASGGAQKAKIFSGARAEAALATRFLSGGCAKKRLTFGGFGRGRGQGAKEFQRAGYVGPQLGLFYEIASGGAVKGQNFLGARAEAALALVVSLGGGHAAKG